MGGGSGKKNAAGRIDHGGRWISTTDYPVPGSVERQLFLQPGGVLRDSPAPNDAAPSRYSYDPKDPCPQIGGNYTYPFGMGPHDQVCKPEILGCKDHLPLSARPDVLTFQTPPLEAAVEVVGPLKVKLFVSSSAVDTDFTAKLVDVYPGNPDFPSGYAMVLIDSVRRMRYRDSLEHAELMTPGQVYEIEIDLWATANRFERGHRIRLDISSSNFPTFDPNPNTGEPVGRHTHTVVAHQTVYHDAERPSHLTLTVLP
jgi:putative CocE/NonD family hydrolase